MGKTGLDEFRRVRLQELIDAKFGGNKASLGRALGYTDGALIGQMLTGLRPITEKTVNKIHDLPGGEGWFYREEEPRQDRRATPLSPQAMTIALAFDAAPNDGIVKLKLQIQLLAAIAASHSEILLNPKQPTPVAQEKLSEKRHIQQDVHSDPELAGTDLSAPGKPRRQRDKYSSRS